MSKHSALVIGTASSVLPLQAIKLLCRRPHRSGEHANLTLPRRLCKGNRNDIYLSTAVPFVEQLYYSFHGASPDACSAAAALDNLRQKLRSEQRPHRDLELHSCTRMYIEIQQHEVAVYHTLIFFALLVLILRGGVMVRKIRFHVSGRDRNKTKIIRNKILYSIRVLVRHTIRFRNTACCLLVGL